jgi:lipid-binding SYLF domain-containing protein
MRARIAAAIAAALVLPVFFLATPVSAQTAEVSRVRDATAVFRHVMQQPDNGIPREILERAKAIAVFPGLIKAGFIFGAERGNGILSVRRPGTDTWSDPAFLTMTGGSWGAQIGGESVDLVLVVMNRRGVRDLLSDNFRIGGAAEAAAGPVGRHVSASTDAKLTAEILSYSRSRGLFAGVTLDGSVIRPDRSADRAFYGEPLKTAQIVGPVGVAPYAGSGVAVGTAGMALAPADRAAVTAWKQTLRRYSAQVAQEW